VRVALRQCPRPRVDPATLLRLLRVEFTDARRSVTAADAAAADEVALRIFVADCERAPSAYTLHLAWRDHEALLAVDLGDVAPAQRPRSLALAVAEFVRTEAVAPDPAPPVAPPAAPPAPTPSAPPPAPRLFFRPPRAIVRRPTIAPPTAARWIVALGLESRAAPSAVAARGLRLGVARRVSASLYLVADGSALFAAPTDVLGAARFSSAELALGPRLAWTGARATLAAGAHLAAGVACTAGEPSRPDVVARGGCGFAARVGASLRAGARLAGPVELWSELGASWQFAGVDAQAMSSDDVRSVGRLAGLAVTASAGVAWAIGR
jgi:hypothetical protein